MGTGRGGREQLLCGGGSSGPGPISRGVYEGYCGVLRQVVPNPENKGTSNGYRLDSEVLLGRRLVA